MCVVVYTLEREREYYIDGGGCGKEKARGDRSQSLTEFLFNKQIDVM